MMEKDFDSWNKNKKQIHLTSESKLYHAREIWWCRMGINIGFEQDGSGMEYQRPVLIWKGFSRQTCLVIPLTTSLKKHPLRLPVGIIDGKQASALLSQIRVIDTKRLVDKVGFLDKEIFKQIRKAAKDLL